MLELVGQVLELPTSHAVAQRGLAFVILPCIMLAVAPKSVMQQRLPTLTDSPQGLVEDLSAYAWAGLQAIKQKHQPVLQMADS
jgi:hypothetical protein